MGESGLYHQSRVFTSQRELRSWPKGVAAPCLRRGRGHAGAKFTNALDTLGRWRPEIVRRAATSGLEVPPHRRAVERTLGWLDRNRRLAKDLEARDAGRAAA